MMMVTMMLTVWLRWTNNNGGSKILQKYKLLNTGRSLLLVTFGLWLVRCSREIIAAGVVVVI